MVAVLKFAYNLRSRLPGSYKHRFLARRLSYCRGLASYEAIRKTHRRDEKAQKKYIYYGKASRNSEIQYFHEAELKRSGECRRRRNPLEFIYSRKFPQAVVKPEKHEQNERQDSVERRAFQQRNHKSGFFKSDKIEFKAYKQCKKRRKIDKYNIKEYKKNPAYKLCVIYFIKRLFHGRTVILSS